MRMIKLLLVTALVLSRINQSHGQVRSSTLQAIFLYQSIKHFEWPTDKSQDFQIIVLGDEEIYNELQKISKSRKVGNRAIAVTKEDILDAIPECHIIVAPKLTAQSKHLFELISSKPILLVTAESGLLEKGSDLNFILKDGKLSFQLNNSRLQSKEIKVSNAFVSMADKIM